jgi:hypothetical protein
LGAQDFVCRAPIGRPFISDSCGALGLGNVPNRADRLAWGARPEGSCEALREFANREGYYQSIASDMLEARVTERSVHYAPHPREVRNYLRTAERPHSTQDAARADALVRAESDAKDVTCAPREFERLDGVEIISSTPDCRPDPRGGYVCAMDYVARCQISERGLIERCQ